MKTRSILLAAATALCTVLAGPSAFAQNCELKIGSMGPMSGGAAQWGLAMEGATRLAAAEYNSKGGIKIGDKTCHITVVPCDSKYTADGAMACSSSLAAQGIHFIVGPVGTPEAIGLKPILDRNEQIAWNASYARDALEPRYPLMFHAGPGKWAGFVIEKALKYWRSRPSWR